MVGKVCMFLRLSLYGSMALRLSLYASRRRGVLVLYPSPLVEPLLVELPSYPSRGHRYSSPISYIYTDSLAEIVCVCVCVCVCLYLPCKYSSSPPLRTRSLNIFSFLFLFYFYFFFFFFAVVSRGACGTRARSESGGARVGYVCCARRQVSRYTKLNYFVSLDY